MGDEDESSGHPPPFSVFPAKTRAVFPGQEPGVHYRGLRRLGGSAPQTPLYH